MKRNSDTSRRPRRRIAIFLAVAAAGLAAIVVAISSTSYGTGAAHYRAAGSQMTAAAHVTRTNRHAVRTIKVMKTSKPSSAIPQNNGGDGDSDNNGSPSDGDGDI